MLTQFLGMATGAFVLGLGAASADQDSEVDLDIVLEGKSVQGVKGVPAQSAPPPAQDYSRSRPYRDEDDYRRDGYGRERTISCRSSGGYNRCDVGGRIWSLRFSASSSSGSCRIGRDWGVEPRAVWVDNGCRATFYIETESRGYGGGRDDDYGRDGYGDVEYIKCQSDRLRYKLCRIYDDFSNVRLEDRHSDAPCRRNTDWGVNREGVWVDNGCRATFSYRVRGYRRY